MLANSSTTKIVQRILPLGVVACIVLLLPDVAWAQDLDMTTVKTLMKKGRVALIVIAVGLLGYSVIDIAIKFFMEEPNIKKRILACLGGLVSLILVERIIAWAEGLTPGV